MASPSSRTELITYAKRQLGEPVLQVNVDDEQVNNVIDDTFQFFQENCYNGMERCYLVHEITADDKTRLAATSSTTTGTTTWDEATNFSALSWLGFSRNFSTLKPDPQDSPAQI